jgi:L-rhamnose isomerase
MPYSAVWDYHCMRQCVPVGIEWLAEAKKYEADVLSKRN